MHSSLKTLILVLKGRFLCTYGGQSEQLPEASYFTRINNHFIGKNLFMKLALFVFVLLSFCCRNATGADKQQESDQLKRDDLEQIEQLEKENQRLKEEAAAKKAIEDANKKRDIIQQIKEGQGLVITKKHDPIGMGGINNGTLILENALSGIVFKTITVRSVVYLANGNILDVNTYTFTNIKPGDTRTRSIPNTGTRGTKLDVHVSEIQSNWLTDGRVVSLE